jgi:hypothetical protein
VLKNCYGGASGFSEAPIEFGVRYKKASLRALGPIVFSPILGRRVFVFHFEISHIAPRGGRQPTIIRHSAKAKRRQASSQFASWLPGFSGGWGVCCSLLTVIEPSGPIVMLRTVMPALSAALTARRTWAWVKVTARVMVDSRLRFPHCGEFIH